MCHTLLCLLFCLLVSGQELEVLKDDKDIGNLEYQLRQLFELRNEDRRRQNQLERVVEVLLEDRRKGEIVYTRLLEQIRELTDAQNQDRNKIEALEEITEQQAKIIVTLQIQQTKDRVMIKRLLKEERLNTKTGNTFHEFLDDVEANKHTKDNFQSKIQVQGTNVTNSNENTGFGRPVNNQVNDIFASKLLSDYQ